ncbi:MotA/TolQ/ExbB proton channel family protein [Flavobacteriales bacterium]|nr:MotA/TolQ/ExbB proton channel family protein [Flavobacteriales bacterium]MDB4088909.1 MotA/TolQ/ExbB proton channel family protein [Flavobacteriales bacterium]
MKKVISLIALIGLFTFGMNTASFAEAEEANDSLAKVEAAMKAKAEANAAAKLKEEKKVVTKAPAKAKVGIVQKVKQYFIDGGPEFMALVFLVFLLGLALSIERIIYLNMSTTDNQKLLGEVEEAMKSGGVDAAKDVCRNTRGPVASIFYQGLDRIDEGVEAVEKSVVNYGSVQAGLLEKNLSWISLFIATAPMLGFLGTIIGIIEVFDIIEITGQTEPVQIAGAMKVALNTTLAGLVAAIVLQVFYNYIVSKIDGIVNDMEDASISLVDMVIKNNK